MKELKIPYSNLYIQLSLFLTTLIMSPSVNGQVVWTEPAFPSQLDDVTVFFDASKGNAGLKDYEGDIYAHTGVITNQSNSPTDWKNVQGVWGTKDLKTRMDSRGNNIYSISYNLTDFYEIQSGQIVQQMAFVFRNEDGSISGRSEDGSDIYYDVYPPNQGLLLSIDEPTSEQILFSEDSLLLKFSLNEKALVTIYNNENQIFQDEIMTFEGYIKSEKLGPNQLRIKAFNNGDTLEQTIDYIVLNKNQNVGNPPAGTIDGINYLDDDITFQIYAPSKEFVFFLCPANDFSIDTSFQMVKAISGSRYWITLPKTLFNNQQNMYQYFVDGQVKIADPYSEIVLDPFNDGWVDQDVLSALPPYPNDKTKGFVTVFEIDKTSYDWQIPDFDKSEKADLVIYEILMRDFLEDHRYQSLIDTLDYLQKLGVNAIELMPVNEFEGNDSWGYNPSFHMALDKYYGSKNEFKSFIDEAHKRGIAVILDVVFNHCFSQSPLAQLYWDPVNFRPAANNPWLNVTPKHPFNVGYDFNHESPLTKLWTKRVLSYWMEEFNIDGFRFDLSKGLTQKDSGNNSNLMAAYDQSRINIINDYAKHIRTYKDDIYIILEHFAVNAEEQEYADEGMLMWSNSTHEFSEAAMGYSSNLSVADYTNRGWDQPGLLSYMESHDEERIRYKVQKWGNQNNEYNTREYSTSMNRILAAATVYYSIPGPKMLWQFGELGYDYSINRCINGSINDNCRLDPKPIKWNYLTELARKNLFDRYAALVHLKTSYPVFKTTDFELKDQSFLKQVILRHSDMDVHTLVNTAIVSSEPQIEFSKEGIWYEYFTGDELVVNTTPITLNLAPGDYRIYTSTKITPPNGFTTNIPRIDHQTFKIYPSIIHSEIELFATIDEGVIIDDVKCSNTNGQFIKQNCQEEGTNLTINFQENLAPGIYTITLKTNKGLYQSYFVKQ